MTQSTKISRCHHVRNIGDISWEEIREKQEDQECETCNVKGTNLWLCLIIGCHYTGCGESIKDHSSQHAEREKHHLTINLSTLRIWCYMCECEVFHDRNNPPFIIPDKATKSEESLDQGSREDNSTDSSPHRSVSAAEETDSELEEDSSIKPRGLTGLQNLGNTCYLNAALQALSNCPPLTRYFLDCQGYVRPEKNPMISKSYLKLIKDVWGKKRPSYLVPNGVVSGIKLVHPMFRGFSQQDTQEFLRCFMDQLHEELKQTLAEETDDKEEEPQEQDTPSAGHMVADRQLSMETSSTSSQSDADYETCDSALGSERGSAEQNFSSDENSDINELSRLNMSPNASPRTRRLHARRIRNSLSKIEDSLDETADKVVAAKEEKEQLNMSKKATENIGMCSDEGYVRTESIGEYVDAVSETEPLQARRTGNTKQTGGSERDPITRQSKAKHYKPTSHNNTNNIQHRSVISDIFDGKLSSSVQCLTCERISTTKETFQDLSLPIPSKDHLNMIHSSHHASGSKGGACSEVHQGWLSYMWVWMRSWFLGPVITLQDCLSAFFSADELKGDNMYSCEKCKKLRNGIKYSKVLQLPEVLCIHLKRFRHEFYSSKISTYVAFPLDNLDMNPYLHKDNTSKITMYDLIAVICHHGTAGGGHYTAYCQNTISSTWYEFDDQYVTEVDVSQVMNCEAYVLFYRKQNDHMNQMRQDAVELMEAREPSLMQFFVSKQWINKFNTFAEPGPITNRDFLCRHGGVPPNKVDNIEQLCEPMTQFMWEFLHERFGGGPACNNLFKCVTCQTEHELLLQRQKEEIESFIKLNEKFKEEDNPSVIYAISMSWFKEWENFVRGKTDAPPGPIENKGISIMKNGQYVVRNNSDHGQLSGEMWQFLHNVYGGGPELIVKQVAPTPPAPTLAAQAQTVSPVKVEKTVSESQKPASACSESTETVKS